MPRRFRSLRCEHEQFNRYLVFVPLRFALVPAARRAASKPKTRPAPQFVRLVVSDLQAARQYDMDFGLPFIT